MPAIQLPGPGHEGPQVFPGLVRRPPRVGPSILGRLFVDPVEEVPNVLPLDLIDLHPLAPAEPLGDSRPVLLAGPFRELLGDQILLCNSFQADGHDDDSRAVDQMLSLPDPSFAGLWTGLLQGLPPLLVRQGSPRELHRYP